MTMTKKDYKLIAEAIKSMPPIVARSVVASFIAGALAKDNPRFDTQKFFKACQGE
jgi:hypothetical protein